MPPGTLRLTPVSVKIQRQRKRPWQQRDVRWTAVRGGVRLHRLQGARQVVSKVRERDLVGNRVPEEKQSASLEELSDSDAERHARVARRRVVRLERGTMQIEVAVEERRRLRITMFDGNRQQETAAGAEAARRWTFQKQENERKNGCRPLSTSAQQRRCGFDTASRPKRIAPICRRTHLIALGLTRLTSVALCSDDTLHSRAPPRLRTAYPTDDGGNPHGKPSVPSLSKSTFIECPLVAIAGHWAYWPCWSSFGLGVNDMSGPLRRTESSFNDLSRMQAEEKSGTRRARATFNIDVGPLLGPQHDELRRL
ncbi:hypothetical protein PCL_10894 [Purpureocillium lilacinum]|uniref:Uncharacterized protein n=1 Tax=Purpureocillium lilacinum TaxID=33203 RepID=A0A2U3ECL8_PURLI|nr:hypothetical protein PCL_10894 [Purpureocillium lilacinum]